MDIDKLFKEATESLLQALGDQYGGLKKETQEDLREFLNASERKIKRWTTLLANETLSMEEYQWLIKSQKDLLAMKGLERMGVSKISIGRFRNKVIDTLVDIVRRLLF